MALEPLELGLKGSRMQGLRLKALGELGGQNPNNLYWAKGFWGPKLGFWEPFGQNQYKYVLVGAPLGGCVATKHSLAYPFYCEPLCASL